MKFHNRSAVITALIILIADQVSKFFLQQVLTKIGSIQIIPSIFHLTLVYNTGAGFGIFKGQRLFFIVFSLFVLAVIIFKWKNIYKKVSIPLGLILGGLFGNLIDRIVHGNVIDFLDFRIWPVFNIADSAITIGVIWIIIATWKK